MPEIVPPKGVISIVSELGMAAFGSSRGACDADMTLRYLCERSCTIVGEVVCCTVIRATRAVFPGTYVPEAADVLETDGAICIGAVSCLADNEIS